MPRTAVSVTTVGKSGVTQVTPADCDVVNGNVVNGLHTHMIFVVHNAHATLARNITFVTPGTAEGLAIAEDIKAIPALATKYFAGFSPSLYGTNIEFDGETTDIEVAVYQTL